MDEPSAMHSHETVSSLSCIIFYFFFLQPMPFSDFAEKVAFSGVLAHNEKVILICKIPIESNNILMIQSVMYSNFFRHLIFYFFFPYNGLADYFKSTQKAKFFMSL